MKKKLYVTIALLLGGILGTVFARFIPGFADGYYKIVYLPVSTLFAYVFGICKLSMIELILYAAIGYVIFCIARYAIRRMANKRPKKKQKENAVRVVTNVALVVSILLALYVFNCGINYHRTGFAAMEGLHSGTYTTKEVLSACNQITKEINELQKELPRNKEGDLLLEEGSGKRAREAMEKLGTTYKSLSGYYPLPKPLLNSSILSYQEVTGIYSPFTVEANYNNDMPDYLKAYVMCHELSHLKGVMREEEANFVAFLACIHSGDATVRYSGLMHAYTFCMNELYERDKEQFLTVRKQLNESSNHDIEQKKKFWEKYDTKIAEISSKVNDSYLKANAQSQGVDSYNEVTGFLVEYYQKN